MLMKDNQLQSLQYKKEMLKEFDESLYAKQDVKIQDFIEFTYQLSKNYKDSKGNLREKVSFAKKILDETDDYNDLSIQAKELTEKIFDFIKKNN